MRARWALIALTATVAVAAACAPAAFAKPPAVDEYTLNLPGADGPKHPDGDGKSDPSKLDKDTQDELSSPDDAPLVAIATDPELGAPEPVTPVDTDAGNGSSDNAQNNDSTPGSADTDSAGTTPVPAASASGADDDRGFAAAAAGTLTEGGIPWLLIGLLSVVGIAIIAGRRRSD